MQTKYIGQEKFIVRGLSYYRITDESADAATQAEWAEGVLSQPNVVYMNGKHSHVVGGSILDKAEDTLLDHIVLLA
jgi:hypothetical protein